MTRVPVGLALRDRLGDAGVRDLESYIEQHEENRRTRVVNQMTERLDLRLSDCAKRQEMSDGFLSIVKLMAEMKVEILRWSFAFWVGQVVVIAALMSFMLGNR
jgi:hypothetical protein